MLVFILMSIYIFFFFFFNDTATTEIYTLSLHDALPIYVKEFAHITRPDGSVYEHGAQVLDALAQDRCGIGISNVRHANSQVKPLALASGEGGPYYRATRANLVAQSYPLTRIIPAFFDRAPGWP